MCFACEGTEHRANDVKCPKMAPKSRAALQKRADSSEGNKGGHNKMRDNMRKLHQLRNEKKAHFHKLGAKTNEADLEEGSGFDESDWGDDNEEEGFAAGAVKSHKCFGVKCATICACNAIRSFSLTTPVVSRVHCGSAVEPGASGLPYYCTSICARVGCTRFANCVDSKQDSKPKK